MPHFANLSMVTRAIRPLAVTATCTMLVMLASACGVEPTATPIAQNTPPPATLAAATATTEPATTNTPTAIPSTNTPVPTATPSGTPTPSPTSTDVPIPSFAWKEVGLAKTYLRDMAVLPGGNNIVLAASSDGLWKSSYDYTQWDKLKTPPIGNPPPGNAKVAISSPNTYYLARHTGCASGLPLTAYRSTDSGQTWPGMTPGLTSVHASNTTVVYGTTCKGVVKSSDSGATWSSELSGSNYENADPYTVASSPDGQSIYAAYASEGGADHLKKSTDGGTTWVDITPQNAPGGELLTTPNLDFVAGTEGRPQDGGLYMANSQGVWFLPTDSSDWQFMPSVPAGQPQPTYYVTAFYVDTTYTEDYNKPGPVMYEARSVFNDAGPAGLGVFRSTNLGATWQQVGDDLGKRMVTAIVVAPHDTTATPGMLETLLAATSDGVWAVPMPPPFK
jgi:photosystem II stability/assembly factor-like uncharacterized protein